LNSKSCWLFLVKIEVAEFQGPFDATDRVSSEAP
jgi:hypothetical protein